MGYIEIPPLPEGWSVSSNHSNHVGIIHESTTRVNIGAHPYPNSTPETGWFAHARPGAIKIAQAETADIIITQMIEAAEHWNENEEFPEGIGEDGNNDSSETPPTTEDTPNKETKQETITTWTERNID